MATFTHFPVPKSGSGGIENVTQQTILTGAAGANITIGPRQIFMVTAFATTAPTGSSALAIKFGTAAMTAAAATDMGLPISGPTFSVAPVIFDTGEEFTTIGFFNTSSATVNVNVLLLNRAG